MLNTLLYCFERNIKLEIAFFVLAAFLYCFSVLIKTHRIEKEELSPNSKFLKDVFFQRREKCPNKKHKEETKKKEKKFAHKRKKEIEKQIEEKEISCYKKKKHCERDIVFKRKRIYINENLL